MSGSPLPDNPQGNDGEPLSWEKDGEELLEDMRMFMGWQYLYPLTEYFPKARSFALMSSVKARDIFRDWKLLNGILKRHEETICKRWLKMTVRQRKNILLKAYPDIPELHRPDNEILCKSKTYKEFSRNIIHLTQTANSFTFMAPHINLEDLSKPKNMLHFLNARGHNMPDKFAHTELLHCPLALWSDQDLWDKLQGSTMIFLGITDCERYGGILQWKYQNEARESVTSGRGMHPGHGMQVLRIQCFVLTFLVNCCKVILHDIPDELMISDAYPELPKPADLWQKELDYISTGAATLEAPYRLPAQLDFGRIKSLVSGRIGALEDHVWALREDPGYFAEVWQGYRDHLEGDSKFTGGKTHIYAEETPEVFLKYIAQAIIVDGYYELYCWHECRHLLVELEGVARKYAPKISLEEDLPQEVATALHNLWKMLHLIMNHVHQNFRGGLACSPLLRKFFDKSPLPELGCKDSLFQVRWEEVEKMDVTRRFFYTIWIPFSHESTPLEGYAMHLDELERIIMDDATIRDMVSSYVAQSISSFSIASSCIHQIRLYQPWATKIQNSICTDDLKLHECVLDHTNQWSKVMNPNFHSVDLVHLGDPSDGKFEYPITAKRTRMNVEKMRLAEANLDRFWKELDAFCKLRAGKAPKDLLNHDITEGRTIRRTPPWFEPPKVRREAVEAPKPAGPEYIYQSFSLLNHDQKSEITGAFDRLSLNDKSKPKTRGTAGPNADRARLNVGARLEDQQQDAASHQQPIFHLDKRAHRVFKVLFHSPLSGNTPSEVRWTDFLHALASTGFSAEKLHGSAWQFTPKSLALERSIQFHEPHPSSKLPFTWARRYGRRLARAYGWEGEMFRLA